MPSIFAGLNLADTQDFAGCGESPTGREILFLIDGFGADLLTQFSEYAPTIAAMKNVHRVETSFPSTTSTSLATLTTGSMPGVHGMMGYTVRVPRSSGRVLNSLKWDERVDPEIWQPLPTLFQRATAAGITVTHVAAKRYEDSGFTRAVFRGAHYRGANLTSDLVNETVLALQKTPSFVYLYVNDLDSAGHSDGVGSEKWIAALSSIDAMVAQLLEKLPKGVRLWITADHGMINVEEKIVMGVENKLLDGIATIAGEPRMRHLYLPQDADLAPRADIIALWRETLGEKVKLFTRESAIEAELFGSAVTIDASERIGDIIVIAQENLVLLDPERADKEGAMIGHHGGDSDTESSVPLLTAIKN
jgi:predicted AlkP superfamily pyrophosphatase or phosphodiesterase